MKGIVYGVIAAGILAFIVGYSLGADSKQPYIDNLNNRVAALSTPVSLANKQVVNGTVYGTPDPVTPVSGTYATCTEAYADGRSWIPRGDPAYAYWLDRDNSGYACENP